MPYDPGNGAAGRRGRGGWQGWVCVLRDGRRLSIRAAVRNEVAASCSMPWRIAPSPIYPCVPRKRIHANNVPAAKVAAPRNVPLLGIVMVPADIRHGLRTITES